jgi:hypothetical protein
MRGGPNAPEDVALLRQAGVRAAQQALGAKLVIACLPLLFTAGSIYFLLWYTKDYEGPQTAIFSFTAAGCVLAGAGGLILWALLVAIAEIRRSLFPLGPATAPAGSAPVAEQMTGD